MMIYPAIDLRGGKVVRLKEGDPLRQTVFSDNPLEVAQRWIEAGTQWIHMVNLDGAFATPDADLNGHILESVARTGAAVQFGGGLRSLTDIRLALERGAQRVVVGTLAVQQPEIVEQALAEWGSERLCIALDARDGKITTHGWQQKTALTPAELGQQMAARGVRHALYTDVSRDGQLGGANISSTIALAKTTGLAVIASGGVSSLVEIEQLAQSRVVAGTVIGMALYEGRFTLADALQAARSSN